MQVSSDVAIRKAVTKEKPYKLFIGGSVYALIRPSGSKHWYYRYRIAGKENLFALGPYPSVGLAEARERGAAAAKLVEQGIHPVHQRKQQVAEQIGKNSETFEAIADVWLEKKKEKCSAYYFDQAKKILADDVSKYIGSLPIRKVNAAQIREVLTRIEKRGAPTVAILARQFCGQVFRHAIQHGQAESNPAADLTRFIERPAVEHHAPLALKDIKDFYEKLEKFGGYSRTRIAMRLMALTFVRTVNLRKMEWSEIDFAQAQWRIPGAKMKNHLELIVPLSTQSVALLRELHSESGRQTLAFPSWKNHKVPLSKTTLNRVLDRMGYRDQFSAHGFRSTASTALNELQYPFDVIERQLGHVEKNQSRRPYNSATHLAQRQIMMQQWADMLTRLEEGAEPRVIAAEFGPLSKRRRTFLAART